MGTHSAERGDQRQERGCDPVLVHGRAVLRKGAEVMGGSTTTPQNLLRSHTGTRSLPRDAPAPPTCKQQFIMRMMKSNCWWSSTARFCCTCRFSSWVRQCRAARPFMARSTAGNSCRGQRTSPRGTTRPRGALARWRGRGRPNEGVQRGLHVLAGPRVFTGQGKPAQSPVWAAAAEPCGSQGGPRPGHLRGTDPEGQREVQE